MNETDTVSNISGISISLHIPRTNHPAYFRFKLPRSVSTVINSHPDLPLADLPHVRLTKWLCYYYTIGYDELDKVAMVSEGNSRNILIVYATIKNSVSLENYKSRFGVESYVAMGTITAMYAQNITPSRPATPQMNLASKLQKIKTAKYVLVDKKKRKLYIDEG